MVIAQGDVYWADLGEPIGSAPGFRRPVVVVQGNAFNRSAIATVIVVPLTSNLERAAALGNVRLTPRDTGLHRASVANVSSVVAIDRATLTERVGHLSDSRIRAILAGLDVVLGR